MFDKMGGRIAGGLVLTVVLIGMISTSAQAQISVARITSITGEVVIKRADEIKLGPAKVMMKQSRGRIINMSSGAARIGVPMLGPYAASKGGIKQLTKVCALEWAGHGITVNAIGPMYIKTPLTEAWLSDPERYEQIIRRSAVKRLGETADLRGVLLLLASDASDYLTGRTYYIDGGSLAGWPIER